MNNSRHGKLISDEHLEFYRDNGFLVVEKMYSGETLDELIRRVEEVQNFPEVKGKYMFYYEDSLTEKGKKVLTRIENFLDYHQELNDFFLQKHTHDRVKTLIGGEPVLFKEKTNMKKPGGHGFKPHQDIQAAWENYAKHYISVSICIDEILSKTAASKSLQGITNED